MKMNTTLPARRQFRRRHQSGVVTLLTAVVILFMATILVIGVSRTTLMEQRISGNEIRKRQAFEAAEFGLSYGLNYLNAKVAFAGNSFGTTTGGIWPQGADKNNDDDADLIPVATVTSNRNKYSVAFCSPEAPITNIHCPDDPELEPVDCIDDVDGTTDWTATGIQLSAPRIVSCGWSDDGLSRVKITQGIGLTSGTPQPQTNPLVSKGTVNVQGSATVTNYFNNLSIWSGGPLSNIGNSGKTFVRNPTVVPPPAGTLPPTPPSNCSATSDYVCATDKNSTGPDVIDSDPTLANMTNDELFDAVIGAPNIASYAESALTVAPDNVSQLNGFLGQAILVAGSVLTTPITLGNLPGTIGSRERPVVLVVNGNWDAGGNTTIYGIVYVRGDIALAGNITVYGGVTVEGGVSGTGSLDIIYDPLVTSNAATGTGKPGLIPGGWRDWN
ncbi:MAG: PilX N-terminal domain-containing pilus assembly protein [Rhodoferax sp.]|jgi:Flp pilus assembly protein TadG